MTEYRAYPPQLAADLESTNSATARAVYVADATQAGQTTPDIFI